MGVVARCGSAQSMQHWHCSNPHAESRQSSLCPSCFPSELPRRQSECLPACHSGDAPGLLICTWVPTRATAAALCRTMSQQQGMAAEAAVLECCKGGWRCILMPRASSDVGIEAPSRSMMLLP